MENNKFHSKISPDRREETGKIHCLPILPDFTCTRQNPCHPYLVWKETNRTLKNHEVSACFQAQVSCDSFCCLISFLPCYWPVVIFTFSDLSPLQLLLLSFAFLFLQVLGLLTIFFPHSPLSSGAPGVPGPVPEYCNKLLNRSHCAQLEASVLLLGKLCSRQHHEVTTNILLCKPWKTLHIWENEI